MKSEKGGSGLAQLAKLAAAEEVDVEMGHNLPALRSAVYHQAESGCGDAVLPGQLVGDTYQMPHKLFFVFREVGNAVDVFPGDNQDVHRGFGVDVGEGYRLLILIDDIALDLTLGDATEDTIHIFTL